MTKKIALVLVFIMLISLFNISVSAAEEFSLYADLNGIYLDFNVDITNCDTTKINVLCEGETVTYTANTKDKALELLCDVEPYSQYEITIASGFMSDWEEISKKFYIRYLFEEDFSRSSNFGAYFNTNNSAANGKIQDGKAIFRHYQEGFPAGGAMQNAENYTVSFDIESYKEDSAYAPSLLIGFNINDREKDMISTSLTNSFGWRLMSTYVRRISVVDGVRVFDNGEKISIDEWQVGEAVYENGQYTVSQATTARKIEIVKKGAIATLKIDGEIIDTYETDGDTTGYFCLKEHDSLALNVIDNMIITECVATEVQEENQAGIYIRDGRLNITGTTQQPQTNLMVMVLNSGKTVEDVEKIPENSNMDEVFYWFNLITSDENGNYSVSLPWEETDEERTLYISGKGIKIIQPLYDVYKIYVSKSGNDNGDGSESSPFATIEKAKEKVKELKSIVMGDIIVEIDEGEYRTEQEIAFNEEDSGTNQNQKIIYKAKDGAKVVFTGGKAIETSLFKKVTDETILNKVSKKVADNLVSLNLTEAGIDSSYVNYIDNLKANDSMATFFLETDFYLNGNRQSLASWPDSGEAEMTVSETDDGKTLLGFSGKDTSAWSGAKNIVLNGKMNAVWKRDWTIVQSADINGVTVNKPVGNFTISAVTVSERKAKVLNLLEEITIPGEWYIDTDTMTMYYYPPHDLTSADIFEISYVKDSILTIENAKNIEISGIEITKSAYTSDVINTDQMYSGGNGIKILNSENISISDCKIYDVGGNGIGALGTDIKIDGCAISNTGRNGIYFGGGGNTYTLESGNNAITNCRIADAGTKYGDNSSVAICTNYKNTGLKISNNIIHNTWNNAIRYDGMETEISYNEIYNVSNNSSDAGAIYTGRSWSAFGTSIKNNYIHDYGTLQSIHRATGVYIDDMSSGANIENNIIVPNNTTDGEGIFVNMGTHNNITGNIIMNGKNGIYYGVAGSASQVSTNLTACVSTINRMPYTSTLYMSRYPEIKQLADDYKNAVLDYTPEIKNNISVNAENTISYKIWGCTSNNTVTSVSGGNYANLAEIGATLEKNGIITAQQLKTTYETDKIGVLNNTYISEGFSLLYPQNGAYGLETDNVTLVWEKSHFADKYRYEVAQDEAFNTILFTGETRDTNAVVEGLSQDSWYYWRVVEINESKVSGYEKISDEVFVFGTTDVSVNDQLTIGDITALKSDGTKLTEVDYKGNVSVTQTINGNGYARKQVKYIVVLFNGDECVGTDIIDKSIRAFDNVQTIFEFDTSNYKREYDCIKILMLDDFKTLKPLISNLVLE